MTILILPSPEKSFRTISFTTAEGLEIAAQLDMSERTFKEWLKSNYFRHISHGQYEKRYK